MLHLEQRDFMYDWLMHTVTKINCINSVSQHIKTSSPNIMLLEGYFAHIHYIKLNVCGIFSFSVTRSCLIVLLFLGH